MIEQSQDEIAARYGYRILRHRHELYGHCAACSTDSDETCSTDSEA
jgi:Fe2+ or Zn2+ uptake regulation protein